jgi:hypothetical protein
MAKQQNLAIPGERRSERSRTTTQRLSPTATGKSYDKTTINGLTDDEPDEPPCGMKDTRVNTGSTSDTESTATSIAPAPNVAVSVMTPKPTEAPIQRNTATPKKRPQPRKRKYPATKNVAVTPPAKTVPKTHMIGTKGMIMVMCPNGISLEEFRNLYNECK